MDLSGISNNFAGQLEQAQANRLSDSMASAAGNKDADAASSEFEALLGTMLAKEMRRGLDEGFFGKGPGGDTFSSWLDEYVGKAMAARGTLGTGGLVKQYVEEATAKQAAGNIELSPDLDSASELEEQA